MNTVRYAHILALLAVLVTVAGCVGTHRVKADVKLRSVADDKATLDAYGYMKTCVNETLLFVDEDGKWIQVEQDLPVELILWMANGLAVLRVIAM